MLKRAVLYLDDETACLNLFREVFGGEYDVRTAATPAEARRLLAARPADVVISDQTMPGKTGVVFLAEVAAAYPSAYRVLLTGSITAGAALHEIAAGVVQAFAAKPWRKEDIDRVMERGGVEEGFVARGGEPLIAGPKFSGGKG